MENSNSKRIAKNTILLYFRQIVLMVVSLYTVRIILGVLGAEDYGIYNVVAGVVTMFSFLSTTMAAASQRFFSFDLGQKNYDNLKKTFSITFEIYLILAVVIVVIAESAGLWFVNNKLVIPAERLHAANFIYHFAILSFIFTFLAAPFMALIISHEEMGIYAYVSLVEGILKLVIVYLLKVFNFDKLILYGVLLSFISAAVTAIYTLFCLKNYKESRISFCWNRKIFSEIAEFSGWCLFGTVAGIVKNQITNILLNIFFGPLVNAARGIAFNVNSAVSSFANNFNMAVRPQIVKSYSSGEKEESLNLTSQTSKLTFFLLFVFMLPLSLEMDYVLRLWLKNVPEYTVMFTRLILLEVLIDSFSLPLQSLLQATGKMRLYQSVCGGILLMNLPASYILLRYGFDQYSVQIAAIIICLLAFAFRIVVSRILAGLSVLSFLKIAFLPCVVSAALSFAMPFAVHSKMEEGFLRLCIVVMVSVICIIGFGFFIGLNKNERVHILGFIRKKLRKDR